MSKSSRSGARRRPRPPAPGVKLGQRYASPGDACPGADPFTPLRVAAIHRDGTIDVEGDVPGDNRAWHNVDPSRLQRLG